MRFMIAVAAPLLTLTACGLNGTDGEADENSAAAATPPAPQNEADSMASDDPAPGVHQQAQIPDSQDRPIMQAQVVLDRRGFGPGVIDGKMGMSTNNALKGFQEAQGLDVTGELDEATKAALAEWSNIAATRIVTIPADWGSAEYEPVPDDPEEQAKMQTLGYSSLDERLAERFHTTIEVLQQLNPGGKPATRTGASAPSRAGGASNDATPNGKGSIFRARQQIRVPNVGMDRIAPGSVEDAEWKQTLVSLGVGSQQPSVARIVVDRSESWLKAYDGNDKLVAMFTVTTGSSHDPLPLGEWGINGVGRNPPFSYDPSLFWDVPDSNRELQLPPGPNGPVGVVWIDLTKEHYGIHGTSAPETIGRAQSHGCVRLTNWDAARLAEMVDQSTEVVFQA